MAGWRNDTFLIGRATEPIRKKEKSGNCPFERSKSLNWDRKQRHTDSIQRFSSRPALESQRYERTAWLVIVFDLFLEMSTHIYFDSDDERDSFDVERRQIELFQRHCLQASIESSEDDDEGIIDGTKVPSSSKARSRARHTYFDISTLSSSPSSFCIDPNDGDNDDDLETNPFTIISKSIDIEHNQPKNKKKKSLGVPKTRVVLDITDIYDQDDSNPSREEAEQNSEPSDKEDLDPQAPKKNKADKKVNLFEEIMPEDKRRSSSLAFVNQPKQQFWKPNEKCNNSVAVRLLSGCRWSRIGRVSVLAEHLVLPTFIPKPLGTWQALEKRSRQELMNEIRAK